MKVLKDGKTIEISVPNGGVREELFAATVLLGDRPDDGPKNSHLWDEYRDGEVAEFDYDPETKTLAGRKVDLSGVDATTRITRLGGLLYLDEVL